MEHESDDYIKWYSLPRIDTRTGEHGNNGTGGDFANDSIAEIGQNTKKNPGDSRRFAVTQTPVENHQLTLG